MPLQGVLWTASSARKAIVVSKLLPAAESCAFLPDPECAGPGHEENGEVLESGK